MSLGLDIVVLGQIQVGVRVGCRVGEVVMVFLRLGSGGGLIFVSSMGGVRGGFS